MKVVIDASNLRAGGGLTHLVALLSAADPPAHGIDGVDVWSGARTLARLPTRPWLTARHNASLDRSLPERLWWQRVELPRHVGDAVLFAPGGATASPVRPRVVMSRNMLPFEAAERARYGFGVTRARLEVLRPAQARQFAGADGVIFLTAYARDHIVPQLARPPRREAIIPHGVDPSFRMAPRPARALADASAADPLRLLYVSTVSPYKHFHRVVEAVRAVRAAGLPVRLDLVGPSDHAPSREALVQRIAAYDPGGRFLRWHGAVAHEALAAHYAAAELFVYASSCENLPNILVEAMAAGLPIACSDRGPMPEVLGDAGAYFPPEDPDSLAALLRDLVGDAPRRDDLAARAHARAERFDWGRCAADTFEFLAAVHRGAGPGRAAP